MAMLNNQRVYVYIYCLTLSPVLSGWSRPYHTYWMVFHHFCAERRAWKWHLAVFFGSMNTNGGEKCNIDPAEVCTVYIYLYIYIYIQYIYIYIAICHGTRRSPN